MAATRPVAVVGVFALPVGLLAQPGPRLARAATAARGIRKLRHCRPARRRPCIKQWFDAQAPAGRRIVWPMRGPDHIAAAAAPDRVRET